MKAEEVMAKMATETKSTPGLPKHLSAKIMADFWRKMVALKHDGFQRYYTQKELGQFNHLKKAIADEAKTKVVLESVLENWEGFCWQVEAMTHEKGFARPNIGFVLKHVNIAVDWATAPKVLQSVANGVPLKSLTVPEAKQIDTHALSAAEMVKLIKEGKL